MMCTSWRQSKIAKRKCCVATGWHNASSALGSIATGRGKLQVQPCPQYPVSDGRPEKGGLTGDRTILGRITKRGNGYLRTLFVQAARVILLRPASWPKHSFGVWLARAAQRLHRNVLAAALANKLARIAWTVLAQERSYEARVTKAAT